MHLKALHLAQLRGNAFLVELVDAANVLFDQRKELRTSVSQALHTQRRRGVGRLVDYQIVIGTSFSLRGV